MLYVQSLEPDGRRTVIPVNRIVQVLYYKEDGKYRVDVWHEGKVQNPYILYWDTDKDAATKVYFDLIGLIGRA